MEELLAFVARHPVLFGLLGVVSALIVANELYGTLRGGRRLSPTEAVRLSNDRDARFVDVRPLADYKRGHVIGAISAPASKIAERNKELDKLQSKPLVVYCALGASAPSVVDKLRKRGFAEVYAMRGGINAWQNAGLPISNKSS
ncbi:rhodanese-like domain-containing protein [Algiphilus sp.]|uniref:rhodanese-like domain-containing protein n=1 Tax=Algiphilus sp. TaxID=1872431 RepID=UPI0025C4255D|nr:rhodanese-like domain-containing protein [Algiphilus sp.]MCK5769804.1 rhodanese-like domain-containing protein [Algiphilus sp.]